VTEWPTWGNWTFTPISGNDLTPEAGAITVHVSVVAPSEKNVFNGTVKVVNTQNLSDYEIIPVYLKTPVSVQQSTLTTRQLTYQLIRELLQGSLQRYSHHFNVR
jgi:hypothetical protein